MTLRVWLPFRWLLLLGQQERFLSAKLELPLALSILGGFVVGFVTAMVNRFCIAFTECTSDRYSQ